MAFDKMFLLFVVINVVKVTRIDGAGFDSVEDMESRIISIEKQCAEQNLKLNSKIEQLEKNVQKQNDNIARLNDEMYAIKQFASQTLQQIGQMTNKRFVAYDEENVAFHATIKGGTFDHLHVNQTIIFNTVMLNIGGAYNPQQGVFVATIPGIYIFSVSIMAVYGGTDSTMVFILKNGKEIAAAIADGRRSNHDQGSTTIVTQLVPGDQVWVSVQRHEDTAIWGDSLDSFMGCLIAQT